MDDAVKYWMDGFNFYPERLEGLYEIITHYRKIGKNNLANLFYQEANKYLKLNLNNQNLYQFLLSYQIF